MTAAVDWKSFAGQGIAASKHAYAYRVPGGAAALVDDGRIVVGCNVDVSPGLVCAPSAPSCVRWPPVVAAG
jgi:hypothetical protein